jgi:nickel-type superoxide dismutase maturation protease
MGVHGVGGPNAVDRGKQARNGGHDASSSGDPRFFPSGARSANTDLAGVTARSFLVLTVGLAALGLALRRGPRFVSRVEVVGTSMLPSFEPGDRLLVARLPRRRRLSAGDVVVVVDPRLPSRRLVKRVTSVASVGYRVEGDNAAASTDSREFGPVPRAAVLGRPIYRYAPPDRVTRLRRRG